jgi:hypothetical protein
MKRADLSVGHSFSLINIGIVYSFPLNSGAIAATAESLAPCIKHIDRVLDCAVELCIAYFSPLASALLKLLKKLGLLHRI